MKTFRNNLKMYCGNIYVGLIRSGRERTASVLSDNSRGIFQQQSTSLTRLLNVLTVNPQGNENGETSDKRQPSKWKYHSHTVTGIYS